MEVSRPARRSNVVPGLVVGAVILGGLGYALSLRLVTGPPVDEPRSLAFLSRVVETVNPMFPRQVDAETEITRLSALEGVLVYHYRFVTVVASEFDQGVLTKLRPAVTKAACSNEATVNNFIKRDVILRYLYSDKAGKALASFDVNRSDCGV
jgi:hypothetical protein